MANKRIKDLTQTATTLANDDYVAIDGSSNGTRKIVKGDLVNDISSQVAGTYLDEANNLSDVASLDTSKLNLEVPDVGTAPNEVPLNGMLGDMAYQSSDGVSMVNAEVETLTVDSGGSTQPTQSVVTNSGAEGSALELRNNSITSSTATALKFTNSTAAGSNYGAAKISAVRTDSGFSGNTDVVISSSTGGSVTEKVRIDSAGRLGIATSAPSTNSHVEADDLVIGDGTLTYHGLSIVTNSSGLGSLMFSDGSGVNAHRGIVRYNHTTDALELWSASAKRWEINASGNLVSSGGAIDFGSGSTLDAYELGTHTTAMSATTSGSITLDSSNDRLGFAIIGDQVFITGRLLISSVSSPTGQVTFTLPTVPKNMTEAGGFGGVGATYYDHGTTTWSVVPINWSEGSSTVYISMDASTLAYNDQFRLSFTYQTT